MQVFETARLREEDSQDSKSVGRKAVSGFDSLVRHHTFCTWHVICIRSIGRLSPRRMHPAIQNLSEGDFVAQVLLWHAASHERVSAAKQR